MGSCRFLGKSVKRKYLGNCKEFRYEMLGTVLEQKQIMLKKQESPV